MTDQRWQKVEDIFHRALELAAEVRPAFLDQACGGDESLRKEVESLLAHESDNGSTFAHPAADGPPQTIAHYRITSKLGQGGMGAVYRATDTKLGREVAIKVLPPAFADDADRLARFTREAKVLASLNHPNIAQIYGIEESRAGVALVMELVEGHAPKGPLPLETVLGLARQIAAALKAAHDKGIVHRDLKPANIIVREDGVVKLLDFGLAKASREVSASRASVLSTETAMTEAGTVMGTAAYMSPEQAQGLPVDQRTDIWAFGVVIYELVSGKRPFQGSTLTETLANVLKTEPDWSRIPPRLKGLLQRCLVKDPAQRLSGLGEVMVTAARKSRALSLKSVGASVAGLVLVAGGFFYWQQHGHARLLTDKDTLVLADFKNTTGDAVFDKTLRQGLAVQLEQSPFLSLVSDQHIQKTLGLMGKPVDARLTPEIARQVCERASAAAVLDGSIQSLGSQYVLGLGATNCRTGDILDKEQITVARKEDVLNALSEIASRFRARVGESLATVRLHDRPLEEATTPSLEALKAFSSARKVVLSSTSAGPSTGIPILKRAIEIDPKFAMAHAFLGRLYGDIGEEMLSAESTTAAYRLRDRTSDAERFFIAANYDMNVAGNMERMRETCRLWAQTYPRAIDAHGLSSVVTQTLGAYEESVNEAATVIEIDPDVFFGYTNLAAGYFFLNRLGDAENTLRRASDRHLEVPDFLVQEYELAFLKGDSAGMDRALEKAHGKPEAENWIGAARAFVLAYSGQLEQARITSRRAVDLAEKTGARDRAAQYEAGAAVFEAQFGNELEARRRSASALALSKARDVEYGAALALSLSGDSQAEELRADLEKRFPEDTRVKFNYIPVLKAASALRQGEPAGAIDALQISIAYEQGVPDSTIFGFFGALYPAYLRGEAYLARHQGAEAAIEFKKILEHRGLVFNDPIGALARLQFGRALAMSGDSAKAKSSYQDFLTLWKNADPDIGVLQQAKLEFAKLP